MILSISEYYVHYADRSKEITHSYCWILISLVTTFLPSTKAITGIMLHKLAVPDGCSMIFFIVLLQRIDQLDSYAVPNRLILKNIQILDEVLGANIVSIFDKDHWQRCIEIQVTLIQASIRLVKVILFHPYTFLTLIFLSRKSVA